MRVQIVFLIRLIGDSCAPSARPCHWRWFRGANRVVGSLTLQQPQGAAKPQLNEKSCLFQIKKEATHSASLLLRPPCFMISTQHPQFGHRHFRRQIRDDRRTCAAERGQRSVAKVPLDFSKKFSPLFRQADGASWRVALAPVRGGELLAASWFAQAFCATFFSVHFRLLYWHRLPLAGSGPFPQTFFHSVFFLWVLLCSASRFASCGFWCPWLGGGMWCERHDRMETPRLPPLVHAIASVHFVCIYDVIVNEHHLETLSRVFVAP